MSYNNHNLLGRHRLAILLAAIALAPLITGCPGGGPVGLDPSQFTSCDALRSDPLVQQALAALATGGQGFTFFDGNGGGSVINGGWDITASRVTYTHNGPTDSALPAGFFQFNVNAANNVAWTGAQGISTSESLRGYATGSSSGASVCLFANVQDVSPLTGLATCSTQNAVFFSLVPAAAADTLSGTFLTVVLAQLGGNCQSVGAFAYGTITLKKVDLNVPVLEPVITIPTGLTGPDSIVLAPNGLFGYFSTGDGRIVRFNVQSGQTIPVVLPAGINAITVSPPGLSPGGSNVGFVTQGTNRLLSYNSNSPTALEAHLFPPDTPSPGSFLPMAPRYNAVASAGFCGVSYQNHRPAIGLFNPLAGQTPTGLTGTIPFNQDGLVGQLITSPAGNQLAAALRASEPAGRARFLGLVNTQFATLTTEVDVSSATFQSFRDDQMVYSPDGSRIYLTTDSRLLSVQATAPFNVIALDIRDAAIDILRHLAVSDDGDVLAATLVPSIGANIVLMDPSTLVEIHRRNVATMSMRNTGGSARFFPDSRVVVVEDGGGTLTPINTAITPYPAGQAVTAFSTPASANIAGAAVGGRFLAVANRAERLIYVFRLKRP